LGTGDKFIAAYSWSVMLITGVGGTDFYPSSNSVSETVVVTVLVVCGALMWAYVLAKLCDVATNSDPGLTAFRQTVDALNELIRSYQVPTAMAQRLREYAHQQREQQLRQYAADRTIPILSTALQVELVMHCHRHWLDAVWFLRSMEEICLVRIAMAVGHRTLAPGEVTPMRHLYVVSRGLVLFGGKVLSYGASYGDDVILSDERYFLPYLARAMSYADIRFLSREELLTIVEAFPQSYRALRRAQILLATRRHIIREVRLMREGEFAAREAAREADGLGEEGSSSATYAPTFLDKMSADNRRKHTSAWMAARLEESAELRGSLAGARPRDEHSSFRQGPSKGASGRSLKRTSWVQDPSQVDAAQAMEAAVTERVEGLRQEMRESIGSLQADVRSVHEAIAGLAQLVRGHADTSNPVGDG